MATKLKTLLTRNDPKIKYISLGLSFLLISICFEALFNLKFNFLGSHRYNYASIPKYYYFGVVNHVWTIDLIDDYSYIAAFSFILSVLLYVIYRFNKDTNSNFKLFKFISNIKLDFIILITFILIIIRYFIWSNTLPFYDNMLVLSDFFILWFIYMLVKNIKTNKKNWYSQLFIVKVINKLIYKDGKNTLSRKVALMLIFTLILQFIVTTIIMFNNYYGYQALFISLIFLICPIICFAFIYYTLRKKLSYLDSICVDVKNIEDGNLKYKLDVKGNDEISQLASSINNITNGLDVALENQIKSEKMKTELITNVSHDLKTPLTSIINYVDILKNNDLDDQTTTAYIDILDRKSKRLKALVEDIFEASKVSSGDIELNFEKTDIKELLIQSIVELEDKIENSSLDFILSAPDESIFTNIDGKRTFRVFENLLNNIIKYSLENTRVYVDFITYDGKVFITLKNISNHRLNISPNELLERFRRGDVSRNTEGSGLGLSIAQNLVILQGGKLDLDIDGDLFKVILSFETI